MNRSENIFPSVLKRLRGDKSQAETARLCGIPQSSYTRYEAGTVMPKHDALCKIATHYGITLDRMLTAAPAHVHEQREDYHSRLGSELSRSSVMQYAQDGLAAWKNIGRIGQFETLMLHVSRAADPEQGEWHAGQAKAILDSALRKGDGQDEK